MSNENTTKVTKKQLRPTSANPQLVEFIVDSLIVADTLKVKKAATALGISTNALRKQIAKRKQ